MKVGDYVRAEDDLGVQLICKIKARFKGFCNTDEGYWDDDHIIKSSPNIIDLIEVGDYVNGYLVIERDIKNELRYIDLKDRNMKYVKNLDIKSIVTKEQFSQMEYRVNKNN